MFKGGIADKFGNRYEAKWLVSKLLDVLEGDCDGLTFEGINSDYAGFEFSISKRSNKEWHQTKINSPGGNWTINALEREKVLSAFANRLKNSISDTCHFISQDKSSDLRALTEEARIADNVYEYIAAIAQEKKQNFEKLKEIWSVDDLTAWKFLRRIFAETQPESGIDEIIKYKTRYLIETDADVFSELREFAEQHINQFISTDDLVQWIDQSPNLTFKVWQQPKKIIDKIESAIDRYLGTYIPFGLSGEILQRTEADQVYQELSDPDGAKVIVCSGVAGSGKSGVIREIITKLREDKTQVLAFRVDQFLDCQSSENLGTRILGRVESPAITLKGISLNSTSVLVIDQLDAVSEVSGRNGAVKSAIFELVREVKYLKGLRVVIACRTYDLENDAQFKVLAQGFKTRKIQIPHLDWVSEVTPLLEKLNFNPKSIPVHQQNLLCIPINLAIYVEIGEPNFSFRSQSDLFAELLKKKQKSLQGVGFNWNLIEPLETISLWMSEQQTLTAPDAILDKFDGAADWLASENLVVLNDRKINFFHESFFDFIYARSFVSTDKSALKELLLTSEQHLFRRTQIRQILTLLREAHPARYLEQLQQVLGSDKVRFHVKLSIAQWLGSITDPRPEEFKTLWELFYEDIFDLLKHTIFFANPNWFSLLLSDGIIKKHLNSKTERIQSLTLRWLSNIAGDYPDEISKIIKSWWGSDPLKAEKLVDWFGFLHRKKPDDALLQLCEDLIRSKPANLFADDGRDRVMMLLHSWAEHDPDKCGGMVAELFSAWFAAHPEANLASSEDFKLLDGHSLSELAEKSPKAFVEGTHNAIIKTVKDVVNAGEQGPGWYSLRSISRSNHIYGFDGLFQLFEDSIGKLVQTDIAFTKKILTRFDPLLHPRFCGLHLEAMSKCPSAFREEFLELLSNPYLLKAGYNGAEWKAFADAARGMITLDPTIVETVENCVFQDRHEINRAKRMLKLIKNNENSDWVTKDSVIRSLSYNGYRQWCVLNTIGIENLTSVGRSHFACLRRKFSNNELETESSVRIREVVSPITKEQCALMKDDHWLRAIKKYDTDDNRDWRRGGADQLSSMLHEQAKNEPERFLRLLLKIPLNTNSQYFSELLRGFKESEINDMGLLAEVIHFTHNHFKEKLSEQILSVIETKQPIISQPGIKEIIFDYAINGESPKSNGFDDTTDTEDSKILSVNDLVQTGERLIVRSVYGGRARAWEALGRLFWHQDQIIDEGWELLESQIPKESSVEVRLQMFEAMKPLFNSNKERYEENLKQLIIQGGDEEGSVEPICILATYYGVNMQKYIDYNFPELTRDLILQLLSCANEQAKLIGWWWQCCEFFRHNRSGIRTKDFGEMSEQEKVLIADIAASAFSWTEEKNFAEELLLKCFEDDSEKVQSQAAEVFRNIKSEDFVEYMDLAWKFIDTPAFLSSSTYLLYSLNGVQCNVMDLVICTAERLVESVIEKNDQHSGRATGLYKVQELLAQEYTSSENFPKARKKILDLVDLMLENEIYGADKITEVNDR